MLGSDRTILPPGADTDRTQDPGEKDAEPLGRSCLGALPEQQRRMQHMYGRQLQRRQPPASVPYPSTRIHLAALFPEGRRCVVGAKLYQNILVVGGVGLGVLLPPIICGAVGIYLVAKGPDWLSRPARKLSRRSSAWR